jgi:hypothetical protein
MVNKEDQTLYFEKKLPVKPIKTSIIKLTVKLNHYCKIKNLLPHN